MQVRWLLTWSSRPNRILSYFTCGHYECNTTQIDPFMYKWVEFLPLIDNHKYLLASYSLLDACIFHMVCLTDDMVSGGQLGDVNCCSSNESAPKTRPSNEIHEQRSHGLPFRGNLLLARFIICIVILPTTRYKYEYTIKSDFFD